VPVRVRPSAKLLKSLDVLDVSPSRKHWKGAEDLVRLLSARAFSNVVFGSTSDVYMLFGVPASSSIFKIP